MLFSRIMDRIPALYRPDKGRGAAVEGVTHGEERSRLMQQLHRLQHSLLQRADPQLSEHLRRCELEPHMYMLRWVRLLFAREFAFPRIWEARGCCGCFGTTQRVLFCFCGAPLWTRGARLFKRFRTSSFQSPL